MERPNVKYYRETEVSKTDVWQFSHDLEKYIDQLEAERKVRNKELLINFGHYWGIDHEGSDGNTEDVVNQFLKDTKQK